MFFLFRIREKILLDYCVVGILYVYAISIHTSEIVKLVRICVEYYLNLNLYFDLFVITWACLNWRMK